MKKKKLSLHWEGTFIELCMSRVNQAQKRQIDSHLTDSNGDIQSLWYDNKELLERLFGAENWWSVDDLDHTMGLIFANRPVLDKKLATMAFEIDGTPATIDPDALQMSFYAPEAIEPLGINEMVVYHGARQDAMLRLDADFEPPFDPSLITLSFLHYPVDGYVLIDLDYDGHDDLQFAFGNTVYLEPRFFGKDHFDDTSR